MGSGLGFTISKEKRNDQYQEADTLQKASNRRQLAGQCIYLFSLIGLLL